MSKGDFHQLLVNLSSKASVGTCMISENIIKLYKKVREIHNKRFDPHIHITSIFSVPSNANAIHNKKVSFKIQKSPKDMVND